MAIEHPPSMDDFPINMLIYKVFAIAAFDYIPKGKESNVTSHLSSNTKKHVSSQLGSSSTNHPIIPQSTEIEHPYASR